MDVEIPERPAPGEVRIRVEAVAFNHLDLWVRRGLPNLKVSLPHRLAADVVGTVEAIGEGAVAPALGTRVVLAPARSCSVCEACLQGRDNSCRKYHIFGESIDGGTCELFDVPASNVFPFPGDLAIAEAAAVPLTFLTAWQMIDKARVERGQTVLVHAAGSGVSVAAIQICKLRGARVIATSTSAAKLARARELGADETILTGDAGPAVDADFVAEARRLTGKRGVDVVVDHVGGDTFARSVLALASGGRLVTCGATSGPLPSVDLRHVFFRQLEILGSTMGPKASMFPILREVERRALRPIVDRVLPFTAEGAREAHRVLEGRGAFGKIVLAR